MSKRFNLREFQQQVLDRLQTQSSGDRDQSSLGIQLGQENWLVDMTDISEVMPIPPFTPVPLTKDWYCGVANVRGNLYSIIDLNAYTRQETTARDAHSRVMLLGQQFSFNAGLLVTRVLGLRNTKDWQQRNENDATSYLDASGQQWHKLDIRRLLSQPEFLQIGE
jgi:twitching motility protein PilI